MVWEALAAAALLERLDYCAIWMMLALQILATRMPYARLVQSMVRSHAHVLKDTKDRIAPKTLTNAFKVIDLIVFETKGKYRKNIYRVAM